MSNFALFISADQNFPFSSGNFNSVFFIFKKKQRTKFGGIFKMCSSFFLSVNRTKLVINAMN